ncbi:MULTISPECIES: hypothetical protein [unclassified Neptuniibacter]|uniref:hypothetical protein n=1 Tax=unclassified Neptuniibacter TaxID=2630693 RepID=UPI0026E386E0|nr:MULTISPECIES: hypothetical protein [unclassified Neptuniibacter]MDO6514118.1 hypothetical protein [Neptuniibacter sp. 2_MG-2023]MDO6594045.1 hypothetical protein [Neptuniibacter sp. 1_MG-2023]
MFQRISILLISFVILSLNAVWAETASVDTVNNTVSEDKINTLEQPLYNPFIERYIIDELKQLRIEQQNLRVEYTKEITDRQLHVAEIAATYATDTVTYFFYLIAATSSALLLVGWTSLRDIRSNIQGHAETKISQLIIDYESRLNELEKGLVSKSAVIKKNQQEIETTNEVQSFWLKAGQESSWEQKIKLYDQILELRPDSAEALTYKADAALELDNPQWAIALCNKALELEADNGHAFFQLACAFSDLQADHIAYEYLLRAIDVSEEYRRQAKEEERFEKNPEIMQLVMELNAHKPLIE